MNYRPVAVCALALAAAAASNAAPPSPEAAVVALVQRHAEQLGEGDLAAAAATCRAAISSGAMGRFSPVAESLLGADILAAGQTDDAAKALSKLLIQDSVNADPVSRAADTHARRWLSRIDREKVVAALKAYYADHVEYPSTLEPFRQLRPAPPLRDRWGDPWAYKLANFKLLKGVKAQRYTLESRSMARGSDLRRALESRPASALPKDWTVARGGGDSVSVIVTTPSGERTVIREGSAHAGIRFVALAGQHALFSSGDNWFVAPLAKGGR